jgi:hypothetical protein
MNSPKRRVKIGNSQSTKPTKRKIRFSILTPSSPS